ncbi:MAG: thymidine phosphorylase family protein [Roseibium sp.]|uniref:thymidine phosphorylase family protein n=1 Tax=Roseibium sp. TaxID=1936156 RepID=UPI002606BD05|nr:thymidine phosphorylase family protein [Roseibium sp.]MCV0426477.1 thymidine phosphorylase family protein [Roseibium sp.]
MAATGEAKQSTNILRARRLGIDTQFEAIVFMRNDCPVCLSEGFSAQTRIRVSYKDQSVIATLFQTAPDLLEHGEIGLSEAAWHRLGVQAGENVSVCHPRPLESLSKLRSKIYGRPLEADAVSSIFQDIVAGRYSDIHLASFITACSARPLDHSEMVAFTGAMIDAGDRLQWERYPVVDKHCVGGLPGNRTSPIIVAIVTACGLTMPKTSSRAITSPAGTADTMETLAPVDLDLAAMRRVVEKEGGCIAWGGAVRLSPADDTLIRVERALDLDSEGQLVASVLSKKIAAGSTHVILDLPVGPTAKVRSQSAAHALSRDLIAVALAFDVEARTVISDGRQPIGRGIGPALEARDVLSVLQGAAEAPRDLRDKSIALAGHLLELGGTIDLGSGVELAEQTLNDGSAWKKFQGICGAQGGMRTPPKALHCHPVFAKETGKVTAIDNRRLAKVAKLAGAPGAKAAGLEIHARIGAAVDVGEPLYTIHAEAPGELDYSLEYVQENNDIFELTEL